jgi:hypothetical protein
LYKRTSTAAEPLGARLSSPTSGGNTLRACARPSGPRAYRVWCLAESGFPGSTRRLSPWPSAGGYSGLSGGRGRGRGRGVPSPQGGGGCSAERRAQSAEPGRLASQSPIANRQSGRSGWWLVAGSTGTGSSAGSYFLPCAACAFFLRVLTMGRWDWDGGP